MESILANSTIDVFLAHDLRELTSDVPQGSYCTVPIFVAWHMRVYIYLPLCDFEDTSVTKKNDMLHYRHDFKECGDSRSHFFGSCFLLMPYFADSLRNNHQQSLFDLRQLLSRHFSRQPRNTTPVRSMNKNAFVKHVF